MTADVWKPDQYRKFQGERAQPFYDLMALVQRKPGMRVVDLGCGPGELTRVLHETLAARETVGVDNSAAMLARTAEHAGGGLRFEAGDIATFEASEPYDLVFSNAALQWVADPAKVLERLTGSVKDEGQIAVQVPANKDYPSHTVAAEVAMGAAYRGAIGGEARPLHVLEPEAYSEALCRLGYREQHVRTQVYVHVLDSRAGVIEWVKGTLLTWYESRMGAELFGRFMQEYRERLWEALPDERPFFYPFKRTLFWGRR